MSKKARVQPGRKKSAARTTRAKPANKPAKRSGKKASAAKRKTAAARQDVPQFAPNFTVYVLPPDTVCLYSEDRKYFLHGEVYCAIAAIIGKGGKGFAEIAAELSKNFKPDEIEQALRALMELSACRSSVSRMRRTTRGSCFWSRTFSRKARTAS